MKNNKICALSPEVVRHVAAGEVVQRPASILKELLENSIDANANSVSIELLEGGIGLVKVKDNGIGIAKDDLPLALERHATSKINSIDDLENVLSLGFRGEALYSIAAVSRFSIESKPKAAETGAKITMASTEDKCEALPSSCKDGTSITVKDLFYNVPARRRFLKSERSEYNNLDDVIKKICLYNFQIAVKVTHNEKITRSLPAVAIGQEKDRIAAILGSDFTENLAEVNDDSIAGIKLSGWVAKPTFSKANSSYQFFYVNGRIIKDKGINYAIKRAYHDVLHGNRFPGYILYLKIDPAVVDVNVHPSKEEIRFQDANSINQFIYRAVKNILVRPLLAQTGQTDYIKVKEDLNLPAWDPLAPMSNPSSSDAAAPLAQPELLSSEAQQVISKQFNLETSNELAATNEFKSLNSLQQNTLHSTTCPPLGYAIGQIAETFILAKNSKGLLIVDMHAAHERVIYERMKLAYSKGGVASQTLLVPISFVVNSDESGSLQTYNAIIEQLGFNIVIKAKKAYVNKLPMLLKKDNIVKIIIDLLHDLENHQVHDKVENAINEIIANMACRSAVKANCYLSNEKMNALLRDMETTKAAEQCNHGRPTCKQITLAELDGFFKRGT
jgi:DNA mismatch repair protein MutL